VPHPLVVKVDGGRGPLADVAVSGGRKRRVHCVEDVCRTQVVPDFPGDNRWIRLRRW